MTIKALVVDDNRQIADSLVQMLGFFDIQAQAAYGILKGYAQRHFWDTRRFRSADRARERAARRRICDFRPPAARRPANRS